MNRGFWLAFIVVVVVLLLTSGAGVARADSLQGCGDCGGGIYTLTYNPTPVSSTATTNTFAVTLTINTAAYTGSAGAFVDAIALTLNVNGGSNVPFSSVTLAAAPGGVGDWNGPIFGGTNSGGCSNKGTAFFCDDLKDAFETSLPPPPSKVGGTNSWTWDVTIGSSQSLVTTALGDDLKVVFMTPADNFDGVQVSDAIGLQTSTTPTPEPSSLLLFGSGLIGLAGLVRRKLVHI